MLADAAHHFADARLSVRALQRQALQPFRIETVFLIHLLHDVPKRLALPRVERRRFGKHGDRHDGVLVPRVRPDETAVALLEAELIDIGALFPVGYAAVLRRRFLEPPDLFADILEARERLDTGQPVRVRDRLRHIRRDDGRNERAVPPPLGQQPARRAAGEDILRKEQTAHVAREGQIFARRLVLCVHAEAVRIGIGRKDEVCVLLLRERERQRKGALVLGIGTCDGGKTAVGRRLRLHGVNVCEPRLREHAAHGDVARPVQGRIDDGERVLSAKIAFEKVVLHRVEIAAVDLLADDDEQPARLCLLGGDAAHGAVPRHVPNAGDDLLIVGRDDLSAVPPIDFVAVIFGRVVARRDDDARGRLEMAHGKRQFGRRAQALEEIGADAVRRQDARRIERKFGRHMPAVIGDDGAPLFSGGMDIVRKTLRRLSDRVDVHAGGADAENAPEPARPEGELARERLARLRFGERGGSLSRPFIKDRIFLPSLPFGKKLRQSSSSRPASFNLSTIFLTSCAADL